MIRILVAVVVTLLLWTSRAHPLGWGVGAHLGLSSISTDLEESGSSTLLSWPSNPFGYQPALRLAVSDARHRDELQFDSGLFLLDESGSTLSLFASMFSLQHTFWSSRPTAPFANVGLGWFREGGGERTSTKQSYGAGIGVRHVVKQNHGALRAEFRFDRLEPDALKGRRQLTTIGLRLGFDLWL